MEPSLSPFSLHFLSLVLRIQASLRNIRLSGEESDWRAHVRDAVNRNIKSGSIQECFRVVGTSASIPDCKPTEYVPGPIFEKNAYVMISCNTYFYWPPISPHQLMCDFQRFVRIFGEVTSFGSNFARSLTSATRPIFYFPCV